MPEVDVALTLPATLPSRRAGVVVAEFDSEFVVFDSATLMVHWITGLPAVVFDACDGTTPTESLVEDFVYSGYPGRAEAVASILEAYIQLVDLALLDGVDPSDGPPCIDCYGASASPQRAHRVRRRRR